MRGPGSNQFGDKPPLPSVPTFSSSRAVADSAAVLPAFSESIASATAPDVDANARSLEVLEAFEQSSGERLWLDSLTTETLYHGTSSKNLEGGVLDDPYVTNDRGLAEYYAECQTDVDGTIPTVIEFRQRPDDLAYDGNAMSEPVGCDAGTSDDLTERISEFFDGLNENAPEWVSDNGFADVPDDAALVSLAFTSSAQARGQFTSESWTVI